MLVDFFPKENIFFHDFQFSFPQESSILRRIPGSVLWLPQMDSGDDLHEIVSTSSPTRADTHKMHLSSQQFLPQNIQPSLNFTKNIFPPH